MQWFRLHSEARTDAKLESLPDDEFRVWFRLLCLANEQSERGVIAGYSVRLLAVEVARGDSALLGRTLASLIELRIVECDQETDSTTFINWLKRQYDKESDWPENTRSRKTEQRSRAVTPSHALSRAVTLSHTTYEYAETETETETETEPTVDTFGQETTEVNNVVAAAAATPTRGALALAPSSSSASTPLPSSPSSSSPPTTAPKLVPLAPVPRPSERPRDLLWDACVVACGGLAPSNKVERGKWNKGLAALRESGATPDEITLRAQRYKRRYGDHIALNPMALASNWTVLAMEVTSHANNNTGPSASAASNNHGRAGGRNTGGAYAGPHLPDADELREWARQQRAAGRTNIIGA